MARKKRGYFIALEGPDGSGKSSQLELLSARLKLERFDVLQTREPGGHPLAEKIRLLLLNPGETSLVPETELFLFLAARAQHVREVILPAMYQRKIVICERFTDSTYAYQVGGRRLPSSFVNMGNRFATSGLKPDLTLLYDLPISAGLRRAYKARHAYDRMESESQRFLEDVRRAYKYLARKEARRIKIIKADRPLVQVARSTWQVVQQNMVKIREQCHVF